MKFFQFSCILCDARTWPLVKELECFHYQDVCLKNPILHFDTEHFIGKKSHRTVLILLFVYPMLMLEQPFVLKIINHHVLICNGLASLEIAARFSTVSTLREVIGVIFKWKPGKVVRCRWSAIVGKPFVTLPTFYVSFTQLLPFLVAFQKKSSELWTLQCIKLYRQLPKAGFSNCYKDPLGKTGVIINKVDK